MALIGWNVVPTPPPTPRKLSSDPPVCPPACPHTHTPILQQLRSGLPAATRARPGPGLDRKPVCRGAGGPRRRAAAEVAQGGPPLPPAAPCRYAADGVAGPLHLRRQHSHAARCVGPQGWSGLVSRGAGVVGGGYGAGGGGRSLLRSWHSSLQCQPGTHAACWQQYPGGE